MKLENLLAHELVLKAIGGTQIGDCIREAALICLKENVQVRMIHNDQSYIANPEILLRAIHTLVPR